MMENKKELIRSLQTGVINSKEFLKIYFENKPFGDKYCVDLLQKGIENKDAESIEEALTLINTREFNLNTFTSLFCVLLMENWHYKHEDIAILLKEIKSHETVECLYKATELNLEYLDYDDTFQFARKCIKALAEIGNEDAIDKLRMLSHSNNEVIKNYALKELGYKNLL